jgi:eukaryotic-like serine/threonine-protein kinase
MVRSRPDRGILLLKMQQPAAALAAFEEALKLRSHYAEALCGRAIALKYLHRFDEALDCIDVTLACDPAVSYHVKKKQGNAVASSRGS